MIRATIQGLQEAQRDNLKDQAAVKPSGGLGRAVQIVALDAHRFMVSITHVHTGALRATERVGQDAPARWHIYLDDVNNPVSGQPVSGYAEVENARGGDHAFIDRTLDQAEAFVGRARSYLLGQFP